MSNGRKRAHTPGGRGGGKHMKVNGATEAMEVISRLSPYGGSRRCLIPVEDTILRCSAPTDLLQRNGQPYPDKLFEFGQVFDDRASQKDIFERTAIDMVEQLITGGNSLLFTYGVTGSGKTYTMTGNNTRIGCGILPRTVDCVFNSIENQTEKCYFHHTGRQGFAVRNSRDAAVERRTNGMNVSCHIDEERYRDSTMVEGYNGNYVCSVFISYLEIYNNMCYDLLDTSQNGQTLDMNTDKKSRVYVAKLREVEVDSADEALQLLANGDARRRVSDTLLNKESSRSHSVFTIKLVMAPWDETMDGYIPVTDSNRIVVSQLSLVDLAGSERAKRTCNVGERLNEASKINQSLMTLRLCLDKLRRNQRSTLQESVPYRESKLTHLFKNYLEGNGRIRMIICVNPRPEDYEENINVLAFAEESQSVHIANCKATLEINSILPSVNRRFYTKWNNEMDAFLEGVVIPFSPTVTLEWDIKDPEDYEAVERLRMGITQLIDESTKEDERLDEWMRELELTARNRLCEADYQKGQMENMTRHKDESDEKYTRCMARLKQKEREVRGLQQRLGQYEEDDEERVATEAMQRRQMKQSEARIRTQKEQLSLALGICEGSPSVAQLRSHFTTSSNENIPANNATQPSSSTSSSHRKEGERQMRPGFYNPKFNGHRRSKSASRVLDHQPTHKIPSGTIMQPRMPLSSKHTRAPRTRDLKASGGYVLTHQEMDEDGNLSTSIIKGQCIPTVGGGTAVCFSDIEKLSHESPTKSTTRL